MTPEPYEWSLWQALKVFLKTIYGDLYGDNAARRRLIGQISIAEGIMPAGSRTLTFLVAGDEAGNEAPIPILFLHGTPGSALCWKGFLLRPGPYRIIALDRPGFGLARASAPDLEKDMGPLGELLERIASEDGKVIVAGHSLGAGPAARLAADHRDRVRGLVLIGGSIDPRLERTFALQYVFTVPPLSWLFTRSIRSSNTELLQYAGFLEKLGPDLAKVICHVAVVHSRDDRLVPFANVDYAEQHFTNAAAFEIVALDRGGHFINHTRIEAIKHALKRHIVEAG